MKNGFSLIELLISISIAALLLALAYPSYQNYLTRTHRLDGQMALFELANRLEIYYLNNHTYTGATLATGQATDVASRDSSPEAWYRLQIVNASDSAYTVYATPMRAQENDRQCESLTLNNLGIKAITRGPTGEPQGTPQQCWH